MEREDHSEHQDLLGRRERLRAERQAAHSAPARVRLRLGAVVVLVTALISWVAVSWWTSGASSGEPLPEPASLAQGEEERPVEQPPGEESSSAADGSDRSQGGEAASDSPTAHQEASVIVHVAGAVAEPQVVELDQGARVADAVEAAGGLTGDSAAQGVNLAAEAADGSFIWVPTVEELEAGAHVPPAAAEAESGSEGETAININTAAAEELEELPGVGPALAERIVSYREEHGGFGSLDELAAVSGIGPSIIENVADDVDW